MKRTVQIVWDPEQGGVTYNSNVDSMNFLALLDMCRTMEMRRMLGGPGRPNESGAPSTGSVRSPSLVPRRVGEAD